MKGKRGDEAKGAQFQIVYRRVPIAEVGIWLGSKSHCSHIAESRLWKRLPHGGGEKLSRGDERQAETVARSEHSQQKCHA